MSDVRSEIFSAIAETEDKTMKVVLLMLVGVLDEIGDKIEKMRADEAGLRAAVLNGHEPVHHAHHEWISKRLPYDEEDANQRRWIANKMKVEIEDQKANKDSARTIRDDLVKNALWVVLVAAAGSGWFLK